MCSKGRGPYVYGLGSANGVILMITTKGRRLEQ